MSLAIAMIVAYVPFFWGVYKQSKEEFKETNSVRKQ